MSSAGPGGRPPGTPRYDSKHARPGGPVRLGGQAGPNAPSAAGSPPGSASGRWWGTEDVSVMYGERLALDRVSFRAAPGRVSA
ncbi:MAG TPA: hypothetical protein VIV12_15320, partial [Streptosporangiaceae bacterium]